MVQNTSLKEQYLIAVYTLNQYRQQYPSLGDIEDEVVIDSIDKCFEIISKYKQSLTKKNDAEQKKKDVSKSDLTPWFLQGKKSLKFFEMILICRREELMYEIEEVRQEISEMKNSYARARYTKIFEYAMKQKI